MRRRDFLGATPALTSAASAQGFDPILFPGRKAGRGGCRTVTLNSAAGAQAMVRVPRFNLDSIDPSWPATPHPAFVINGATKDAIYVGKYQASLVAGKAVSRRGVVPAVSVNFDQAISYCAANGPGWHLMTNAEWAAIALWCWKNGLQPRGNTNWGQSSDAPTESGVRGDGLTPGTGSGDGKTLAGSGPVSWNHDGTPAGIADLNGNVWEWVGGMRQLNGEIQIIPNNDAADSTKSQLAGSTEWKAVSAADGSLVAPGSAGTCKYDSTAASGGSVQLDDVLDFPGNTGYGASFEAIPADTGITVPGILKHLSLFPPGAGLSSDHFWINNTIEGLPVRGGDWNNGANAGVFDLYLTVTRGYAGWTIGFRPAFAI